MGTERRSSSRSSTAARPATATAPSRARRHDLPPVRGPRRGPQRPPDDARPDGQRPACPRCNGEGTIVETPCETCHGDGRTRAQAQAARDDPAGHRRRPPDPAVGRGRGGAPRRADGQPVRRGHVQATRAQARRHGALPTSSRSRSPRPPSGRASRCPRSRATRRSRSSPAPSPGPRSGCAAGACPISAGRAIRGDLHVLVKVAVPTKLNKRSASCSRPTRPIAARRSLGGTRDPGPGQATRLAEPARRPGARSRGRPTAAAAERRGHLARAVGRWPTSRRSRPSARSWPVRPGRDERRAGVRAGRRGSRRAGRPEPAGDRAGVPARPGPGARATERPSAARPGPGPPPGVRPAADRRARDAVVHEADWAHAWKSHFPVLRDRPADRDPADLAPPSALARRRRHGPRPGDGLRDRAAPDDPAVPGGARIAGRRGLMAEASTSSTSAAARGSSRSPPAFGAGRVLGVDTDPIAVEATRCQCPAQPPRRRIRRARALPSGEARSTSSLANLIASVLVAIAAELVADLRPGGRCWPRASSSTARRT